MMVPLGRHSCLQNSDEEPGRPELDMTEQPHTHTHAFPCYLALYTRSWSYPLGGPGGRKMLSVL